MEYPRALEDLIFEFQKYPGIGRKTAERYAMFTIHQLDADSVEAFAKALIEAKAKIKPCSVCGHLTDQEQCSICSDSNRDTSKIMVVESSKDVFSIEKSSAFKGRYHILGGALSPLSGVGVEDLNFPALWKRLEDDGVKEVILATSATQEGEATALYIGRVLKSTDLTITRIGYGVPVGSNLEYTDDLTISKAIENRRVL